MKKKFLLLLFLLFIFGCGKANYVEIKGFIIFVDIADSPEERAKGLMGVGHLAEEFGMLFVFEDSDYRTFWMKDTFIPLDIIFITEDFKINEIVEAEPCLKEPCDLIKSKEKAKYVLEVNKGFSGLRGINAGDEMKMNNYR